MFTFHFCHSTGAPPYPRCIEKGDYESGVSFMKLNEQMDAGPCIFKAKLQLKTLIFMR
ncbi:MAG: hypothetical protein CM15mP22_5480 [Gammaproteobacteria bacterium]|nr:MAG: hypothetical protein CM15mP22_5480 [Gammaproteobacteria bacterium]